MWWPICPRSQHRPRAPNRICGPVGSRSTWSTGDHRGPIRLATPVRSDATGASPARRNVALLAGDPLFPMHLHTRLTAVPAWYRASVMVTRVGRGPPLVAGDQVLSCRAGQELTRHLAPVVGPFVAQCATRPAYSAARSDGAGHRQPSR